MFACSYITDAVWVISAAVLAIRGGDAALGFLASSGIAYMISWYSLRTYDRHAFTALVHAEWGVWSSSALLGVASRLVDAFVHVVLPSIMLSLHLGRVKLWMSPVAMLVAVGMHRLRRLSWLPLHRFLYYQFSPRRSPHFWDAAFSLDVLLHGSLPVFCHLVVQQPVILYVITLLAGSVVVGLQLLRSMLLPKVRGAAADIMRRLLAQGNIYAHCAVLTSDSDVPNTPNNPTAPVVPIHIVIHDGNFWLDWMSDGLVAIGESYVSGQWNLQDIPGSSVQLDTLVHRLLTLPVEARRDMYQSWPARWVSLATRVCQFPSSAACHVVDRVKEDPHDQDPAFRARFLGSYKYLGCGVWQDHAADSLDTAQERALHAMAAKLSLGRGHLVLDLNLGSGGGVGCFLAAQYRVQVISVVLSRQEHFAATQLAQHKNVESHVQFILVDDVQRLAQVLQDLPRGFDAVTASRLLETSTVDVERVLDILKAKVRQGRMVLEFTATPTRANTYAWTNKYMLAPPKQPLEALSFATVRSAMTQAGWIVGEATNCTDEYDATYVAWHARFRAAVATASMPHSFRRTWEFYLLHMAACYRARNLQAFQVTLS